MIFGFGFSVLFFGFGAYMLLRGKFASTRYMGLIPLIMAVMELSVCTVLSWGEYPVFTTILVLCRVAVLVCCRGALKCDAAKVRNQRRRRAVARRIFAESPELRLVSSNTIRRCA